MIVTEEMKEAIALIKNTNESIYITGKAGTGKTTFLRYIISEIQKNFIITAPTGVAAVNAGGITLHSFLNIPFGFLGPYAAAESKFYPAKKTLVNAIDAIIIDEISMVRADIVDFIDAKLRIYRKCNQPFGGIQVIMFGDLHQLPPVVTSNEKEVMSNYYKGPYFFDATVWREKGFKIIELTHIFRQSDPEFIGILNNIRNYKLTPDNIERLEELRNAQESKKYDGKYIHICSLKNDAWTINTSLLGTPTHSYAMEVDDGFASASAPCDETLELRVGARVMAIVNDREHLYYNGSLGIVLDLDENSVTVRFDDGNEAKIERYTWEQFEYKTEKNDKGEMTVKKLSKGTCKQIPLTLAWAITIHKSQGLTFDNVVIHSKGMFCPGQLYVALSRCRTMEGIVSESFISQRMIFPDHELSAFEKACKERNNIFDRLTYRLIHNESQEY